MHKGKNVVKELIKRRVRERKQKTKNPKKKSIDVVDVVVMGIWV